MSPYSTLVGQRVIVRASQAGVYVGIVSEAHPDGVTLARGSRQLHYWSAGGSVPQIAELGIRATGSRVTAPSSAPLILAAGSAVVQVCQMTDIAWDRVMACPVWGGGL
ncbi:MAG: hypothetical protein RIS45_904 [Planctomycetota bacterium]|jgi:hypothetical protein